MSGRKFDKCYVKLRTNEPLGVRVGLFETHEQNQKKWNTFSLMLRWLFLWREKKKKKYVHFWAFSILTPPPPHPPPQRTYFYDFVSSHEYSRRETHELRNLCIAMTLKGRCQEISDLMYFFMNHLPRGPLVSSFRIFPKIRVYSSCRIEKVH
jgi:hypothetical protein